MEPADLLERDEHRSTIAAALRRSRQGDGELLVVEGAAGLGKSRLLLELRRLAGPDQRVLAARAGELERAFAFGVVRQLFEALVRDPALGPIACDGAAAGARDVFEETPGEGHAETFASLHGLHWLALNLAELQPLVLVVDDLQWCDDASLRYLAYLGRRLEGTPILLAVGTRPVVPNGPAAADLAMLLDHPDAVRLVLPALSAGATRTLLRDALAQPVDAAFAEACASATSGNPLLLRQLARSLRSDGVTPDAAHVASVRGSAQRALSRTVLTRVHAADGGGAAVARAVAVLGDVATERLVADLTGLHPREVGAAWNALADAEVLRRDRLEFVHALVRDAVYHDRPDPHRQQEHLRAARALHAAGASDERVAVQLALAPPREDPWVAATLRRAGESALDRGAPEAAARHLRRALAEPPPPAEREATAARLAEALFMCDGPGALELLGAAVERAEDPVARGAAEHGLVQALALTDRWDEAARRSRGIQDGLPADDPRVPVLQASRAVFALFGADDRDALPDTVAHRTLRAGAPDGERLRAGQAALWWMFEGGPVDACADLAAAVVADAAELMEQSTVLLVSPLFVLAVADREEAFDLWTAAQAGAHRSGSMVLHHTVATWLGWTRLRRGDLSAATAGLHEALALHGAWGSGLVARRFTAAVLARALVDAGRPEEARRVLDGVGIDVGRRALDTVFWHHADAWAHLAAGHPEEALRATALLERAAAWLPAPIALDWREPRAVALHRLGREEEARAAAEDALAIARAWGAPSELGRALRRRGELRGAEGEDDLRAAVAVLEGSPARLELARALLALGVRLRLARRPTEARGPLERAFELAAACGAPGLAEDARTELAAAGVRRRPDALAGLGALTPSERRVADLAGAGRTNREIAQELFVTPKTVEVHLSATYRKLGVAGRRELPAALAG